MSKILEAIDKLATQKYAPGWNNPAVRKFIETGDEGWMTSIPPFQNGWAWELTNALPDPDAWTEEASRLLHLAHSKGLHSLVDGWLKRFCNYGNAKWQQFDDAVKTLLAMGLSDSDVREFLLECSIWDHGTQRPTPAGELVLKGTDAEILRGIQQGYSGEGQLPALLAHSQPERLEKLIAGGLKFKQASDTYGRIARAKPIAVPLLLSVIDRAWRAPGAPLFVSPE